LLKKPVRWVGSVLEGEGPEADGGVGAGGGHAAVGEELNGVAAVAVRPYREIRKRSDVHESKQQFASSKGGGLKTEISGNEQK